MIDLSDMCTYVTLIILIHTFLRVISDYNKKYKCYNKYNHETILKNSFIHLCIPTQESFANSHLI